MHDCDCMQIDIPVVHVRLFIKSYIWTVDSPLLGAAEHKLKVFFRQNPAPGLPKQGKQSHKLQ